MSDSQNAMTNEQNAELEWIKEELRNMFVTDYYNRLLYDVFLDSDRSNAVNLTSTRRALFFVFDNFEKLLSWGQKDFNMYYDPVTVKIFDLNVVKDVFGFTGPFLKTVNSALQTPFSLCVFISVRCGDGFQTLYGAAYVGKETQEYKEKRLSHFGSRCNLTFNCENMGAPTAVSNVRTEQADDNLNRRCKSCSRTDVDLFKCVRCNNVFYCGRECQKTDWNDHKKICKEK